MSTFVLLVATVACALLILACAIGKGSTVQITKEGGGITVEQPEPAASKPKGSRE